jgi:site-specific DNA-methyltransferase (adenine-specific)
VRYARKRKVRTVLYEGTRRPKAKLGGAKVFCNPPYGSEIKKWVRKCYEESRKPNTVVVMLIPARTDTTYFHDYIYHKAELRCVRGRLKFGGSKQGAPFPSMVVVFKNNG